VVALSDETQGLVTGVPVLTNPRHYKVESCTMTQRCPSTFCVAPSDDGRVQRGLVTHFGKTVHVKEAKASSLLACNANCEGQTSLKTKVAKSLDTPGATRPLTQRSISLDSSPEPHGCWEPQISQGVENDSRRIRKIAKSDYKFRHVCPSVCLPTRNNSVPAWRVLRNFIFLRFSKICRGENSKFVKIWQ
jgi:hypothetical protein